MPISTRTRSSRPEAVPRLLFLVCLTILAGGIAGIPRQSLGMGGGPGEPSGRETAHVPQTPGLILGQVDGAWRYDREKLLAHNPSLRGKGLKEGLDEARLVLDVDRHRLTHIAPDGDTRNLYFEIQDETDHYVDLALDDFTVLRLKPLGKNRLGMIEVRHGRETGGTLFFMR
ncbi:MAG: hypothetical protein LBO77_04715 [Desulfovibrio sp.]|nr:hypothetical protein [Desulfovibrio sp.]